MTGLIYTRTFRQSCVAVAVSLLMAQSAFALQDLSDESLSKTTGEGVALLPENFKFVFQGANDVSASSSYGSLTDQASLLQASKKDTGFIRIIPRGENYDNLYNRTYNKIVKDNYASNAAYAKANLYTPSYDKTYTSTYNSIYQSGSTTSTTYTTKYSEVSTANTTLYTNQEIGNYYNSEEYQAYYKKRKDQYYYNSTLTVPNDGTTKYSGGWLDNDKAAENAYKNTIEKIQKEKAAAITATVNNRLKETTLALIRADAEKEAKKQALIAAETTVENYAVAEGRKIANTSAANAVTTARTKADVFIYGLALSKSNSDMNQRYSNQGVTWGSAENPWLFRSGTAKDIQQFSKDNKSDIAYIALEAPLAKVGGNSTSDRIKLGFWTDIFSRSLDSSSYVNPVTGAPDSGLDKDYRLRAQFVANGLSIDGSQLRVFQTQASTVAQQNYTLGMASVIRLNTNDDPSKLSINDADLNAKGIRISTATLDESDKDAATPALNGGDAPLFNAAEGLYMYSTNINLVLGNMYQPFILGSEGNNIILEVTHIPNVPDIYSKIYTYYADTDGSNSLVRTKDGTGAAISAQLKGADGVYRTLEGSTCNVAQCGSNISEVTASSGTIKYQGTNATHSSIAIGSVTRDANNMLKANTDASATGIVFKNAAGAATNLGSAVIDGVLIQHLKIKTTGL